MYMLATAEAETLGVNALSDHHKYQQPSEERRLTQRAISKYYSSPDPFIAADSSLSPF